MAIPLGRLNVAPSPIPRSLESVAVVADAHLRGGESQDVERFCAFLSSLPEDTDGLILLGDLFEVWVGFDHLQGRHHVQVLEALAACRERGLYVAYIEGNRDFYLNRLVGRGFDWVGERLDLEIADRPWAFVHGDRINPRDYQYRVWRWCSRSLPFRMFFQLLPGRTGRRVLRQLERRLSQTNLGMKSKFPAETLTAFFERERRDGPRNLALGHFHRQHLLPGPDGTALWIVPAWMDGGSWLQINKEGARIRSGLPQKRVSLD